MASVLNSNQKDLILIRNFFDEEETSLLQQASYKDKNMKKYPYERNDSEGLITKMIVCDHPDNSILWNLGMFCFFIAILFID